MIGNLIKKTTFFALSKRVFFLPVEMKLLAYGFTTGAIRTTPSVSSQVVLDLLPLDLGFLVIQSLDGNENANQMAGSVFVGPKHVMGFMLTSLLRIVGLSTLLVCKRFCTSNALGRVPMPIRY